ncbi:lipocalin-like domain-containing protein [Costertonia aggregata]|uniref:Lipocalin family protein n=1 Tax=Costertonia aggregata TaxID=343403 RepID=A0A7H9AMV2_9FLAO|nr:lipocalin family protein [Costertonia aggregata]QLG44771.1 lipocalin family protein [Costertonia aggregata]
MKKINQFLILLIGFTLPLNSCSKDESDNEEGKVTLIGQWELSEFKVTENASNPLLPDAEIILSELIATNCKILEYDFRANGEVFSESTILYIGTDPENISCPSGVSDSFSGTWELNGDTLIFNDGQGTESEGARISLSKDRLIIYGEGLSAENLSGTEFVLTRK